MARGHDHYLPAMHLRGFRFDERRLWQLDLHEGTTLPISVRDAGVESGLNTVRRGDAVGRDLETFMAFNESATAPILARLRSAPTGSVALSVEEDAELARYLALLYMRSPHRRAQSRVNSRELALRTAGELADPEAFARRIARAGIRADPLLVEVVRLRYLVRLRQGLMPEGVTEWPIAVGVAVNRADVIAAMTKFVVRRDRWPIMVCGDSAVVLMRDVAYYAPGALGFASPGTRVVVPIASDAFLVCGYVATESMPHLAMWSTEAFASFVNRASIQHATRFVFGKDPEHLERALAEFEANRIASCREAAPVGGVRARRYCGRVRGGWTAAAPYDRLRTGASAKSGDRRRGVA